MRRRINWFQVLNSINDSNLMEQFFKRSLHLYKGQSISSNRICYHILKKYYSTTTIDELCEKLGI